MRNAIICENMEKIEIILMVACAAAFVVLLVKKWGIAEWMQVHGDRILSELFSCDLCMSFWSSVLICFCMLCMTEDLTVMLIPIFSTPITRMLV